MTKSNVSYTEEPARFDIRTNGSKAVIVFPVNVTSREVEDETGTRTEWVAEKVYEFETNNTPNLSDRVDAHYEQWRALSMVPETPKTTVEDLEEAINALTDLILGGE